MSEGPKRILVLGATGRLGHEVVRVALARDNTVTALARRPEKLADIHGVKIVIGDTLHAADVARSVAGNEAVICLLGPVAGSPPALRTDATRHLVWAMRDQGVHRLVCVTGAMVGHPREHLGLVYRMLTQLPGMRSQLDDGREQERLVRQSSLDWTLVRPTRLTDGQPTGHCRMGSNLQVGAFAHVARADLALLLVREAERVGSVHREFAVAA